MGAFTVKRASKKVSVILDLGKAAEIEELADRLAEIRESTAFESEASGLEERRLLDDIRKKQQALEGGADTLVLDIHALSASEYEQLAIQSNSKVKNTYQTDIVKLVTLVLKKAEVTASIGGNATEFTDADADELVGSVTDWQLADLYKAILSLNVDAQAPKAVLLRASKLTRASSDS